jgi:hypothetical protein
MDFVVFILAMQKNADNMAGRRTRHWVRSHYTFRLVQDSIITFKLAMQTLTHRTVTSCSVLCKLSRTAPSLAAMCYANSHAPRRH